MKRKYDKIIKTIAIREGVSEAKVYDQIKTAIFLGFNNPDSAVKAYWQKISPDGKMPTPEQFIKTLAKEVNTKK